MAWGAGSLSNSSCLIASDSFDLAPSPSPQPLSVSLSTYVHGPCSQWGVAHPDPGPVRLAEKWQTSAPPFLWSRYQDASGRAHSELAKNANVSQITYLPGNFENVICPSPTQGRILADNNTKLDALFSLLSDILRVKGSLWEIRMEKEQCFGLTGCPGPSEQKRGATKPAPVWGWGHGQSHSLSAPFPEQSPLVSWAWAP